MGRKNTHFANTITNYIVFIHRLFLCFHSKTLRYVAARFSQSQSCPPDGKRMDNGFCLLVCPDTQYVCGPIKENINYQGSVCLYCLLVNLPSMAVNLPRDRLCACTAYGSACLSSILLYSGHAAQD